MYKYIFGPVPSRRLGMSLGVDMVPHKVCSLNCVYCECGRTTNLTVDRKEYVPLCRIIKHFSAVGAPGSLASILSDKLPIFILVLKNFLLNCLPIYIFIKKTKGL